MTNSGVIFLFTDHGILRLVHRLVRQRETQ